MRVRTTSRAQLYTYIHSLCSWNAYLTMLRAHFRGGVEISVMDAFKLYGQQAYRPHSATCVLVIQPQHDSQITAFAETLIL